MLTSIFNSKVRYCVYLLAFQVSVFTSVFYDQESRGSSKGSLISPACISDRPDAGRER